MRKCYTQQEIDFIMVNYETKGPKYCASVLDKSWSGVQKVGSRLGLKANNTLICNNSPLATEARKKQGKYLSFKFNKVKLTSPDVVEIRRLYTEEFYSYKQLANKYNCSYGPIKESLKGLPKRGAKNNPNHFSKTQGSGAVHHSWKGGFKDVYNRFRDLSRYWDWRKLVLARDSNKFTKCNSVINLRSHHIETLKSLINRYCALYSKALSDLTYIDLTDNFFYDLNNGITYCDSCHRSYHKQFGRK
jgi:hypothetical protein